MPIWDDIRRGAQSVVDVARLKAQVRQLEATLGDRIYDLGTQVLELHRRNELHHYELDQVFVVIQGLQRELRERESELEQILGREGQTAARGRAACPDCGAAAGAEDRFCRTCGAALRG